MVSGLILSLLTIVLQQASASDAASAEPFVERTQRQFNFYPGGKVQIEAGVPGNLTIVGWDRATVTVDFERIIYRLSPEQARELAAKSPVQVRYTQTLGTIRTPAQPSDNGQMEINMTVKLPKLRTDIGIRMMRGDLSVSDVTGWIEATLTEGSVEAKGLAGYFSVVTQQGDIDLLMTGKRWTGHSCTASTQRGTVAVVIPPEYSAALQLETRDGEISINYPEQLVEGESVPLTATAKKNGRSLNATVGDGGSPVRVRTAEGSIRLTTP
jgi:hypothetical protein